jgi:hypothetical protein
VPLGLRSRHPRLVDYLADLPAGILSYPECQAHAGLLGAVLAAMPRHEVEPRPDPFVAALLQPSRSTWIPEVRFHAALLAIADGESMSDAGFLTWVRAGNAAAYRGLVYRALMAMISPAQLLERAASRWDAFHRGSRLSVTSLGAGEVRVQLSFPPRSFTPPSWAASWRPSPRRSSTAAVAT